MSSCAIITGGIRGIGKAIAIDLAKQGYDITISYVSGIDDEVRNSLINEFNTLGKELLLVEADVVNFEECQSLVDQAIEKFETVEVLVNNAGITKDNLIMRMSPDDFKAVVDVNLNGSFNMIKAVQKHMMRKKYGRIINIASVIGQVGNIGQANYAASKAGVIALSKSAAQEFASRNITVNCIAPGFIATDMTEVLDESVVKNILNKIPIRKLGTVSDVVNVANFLASPQTSYVTGQVINVCGGMVM